MIGAFFSHLLELSLEIAPLLFLGLGIAGLLHLAVQESLVLKHLGKGGWLSVIKGTLFAIPLPLCSCSVVPVVASLRRKGASTGASVSFLVAAPQIGADSWMLTHGLLGPLFAGYRVLAAFVTAFLAGGLLRHSAEEQPLEQSAAAMIPERPVWYKDFLGHTWELFGGLAGNLISGLFLAALILLAVPEEMLRSFSNESPLLSMLVMLVVGIPMYVCATASTPIAAALVLKGLDPGAALVFLLTGPATNLVTMAMLRTSLGWRALMVYVGSIAGTSLLAGWLMSFYLRGTEILPAELVHLHEGAHPWWRWASLFLLVILLLVWAKQRYLPAAVSLDQASDAKDGLILQVDGMTCTHCAARVRQTLEADEDVDTVVVDLGSGQASVRLGSGRTPPELLDRLCNGLSLAGYEAKEAPGEKE